MIDQKWPILKPEVRFSLMQISRSGKIPIVIDSDTYNEIDDQIAIVWALLSPERIDLQAIYAAPFTNNMFGEGNSHCYVDDAKIGMELSYKEIINVFGKLASHVKKPPVFYGSANYLKNRNIPEESPAVKDLIYRARHSKEKINILSIGAPTNIANALLIAPDIINNIHVIWLGGNSFDWKDNNEFNLFQDITASRTIFDSGVALTQIPCFGVSNCMASSVPEMKFYFSNTSNIGNYFASIADRCPWIGFASRKVIWDITTVGYVLNPDWYTMYLTNSPIINDNYRWSFDNSRHLINVAKFIERDELFKDMFHKVINADLR